MVSVCAPSDLFADALKSHRWIHHGEDRSFSVCRPPMRHHCSGDPPTHISLESPARDASTEPQYAYTGSHGRPTNRCEGRPPNQPL